MIRLSCYRPVSDPAVWGGKVDQEVFVDLTVSEWNNGTDGHFKVSAWHEDKVGRMITFKTYDEAVALYLKLQEDECIWDELLTQHGMYGA